jgi:lysozyme
MTIIEQLKRHEGVRKKLYRDTLGFNTIGCGRNLDTNGISDDEVDYLLANDIKNVNADLDKYLSWWRNLDDVRQRCLEDMAFNLGVHGLLGFKNMLLAMQDKNWEVAANEMMDSKWASQVGGRATRLEYMMRNGKDLE